MDEIWNVVRKIGNVSIFRSRDNIEILKPEVIGWSSSRDIHLFEDLVLLLIFSQTF